MTLFAHMPAEFTEIRGKQGMCHARDLAAAPAGSLNRGGDIRTGFLPFFSDD